MNSSARHITRSVAALLIAMPLTLSTAWAQNNAGDSSLTPSIEFSRPAVSGYDTYQWTVQVQELGSNPRPYWYWAQQSSFNQTGSFYFGLQPNGALPNGQIGQMALFSFFGNGTSSSYSSCVTGADGGAGTSCHIPYAWVIGRNYTFSAQQTATNPLAQTETWTGTVTDGTTGATTVIGVVTVPSSWGLIAPGNVAWAEWYNGNISCASRTYISVLYNAPIGYYQGRPYQETVTGTNPGTCATYSINASATQVLLKAGGSK
ncbi:MAG TPA: hypothetical protein VMA74_01825 [Dyella sp.]|uniref:hypothetical protein n=1 Tax=Dyella sp. TaxID=1869338 RepID=UPI002CC4AE5C|nr:hypothetical protein [Dyella sp.]HUB88449.1 hypothetical protein [Dyella sp.]